MMRTRNKLIDFKIEFNVIINDENINENLYDIRRKVIFFYQRNRKKKNKEIESHVPIPFQFGSRGLLTWTTTTSTKSIYRLKGLARDTNTGDRPAFSMARILFPMDTSSWMEGKWMELEARFSFPSFLPSFFFFFLIFSFFFFLSFRIYIRIFVPSLRKFWCGSMLMDFACSLLIPYRDIATETFQTV